jgi:NADPH oxidase 1
LPLDENLWMHRQLAYSILFFTICHTSAHYVNFFNV